MATINGTTTTSTTLTGTGGADTIIGDTDWETISGAGGNDTLDGTQGYDTLTGGAGSDTFVVQAGTGTGTVNMTITDFSLAEDKLDLRPLGITDLATFQQLLRFDPSTTTFYLQAQVGSYVTRVTFQGLPVGDFTSANLIFSTNATNDTKILAGYGDLIGGAGADTLSGSASSYDNRFFGEAGSDSIDGGGGHDALFGGGDNDTLLGGAGYDTLEGGAGADRLDGQSGDDFLTGGAGADTFVYSAPLDGTYYRDVVTDFDLLEDRVDVSALGISDLATVKRLANGAFTDTLRHQVNGVTSDLVLTGISVSDLKLGNVVLSTAATNDNLVLTYSGDLFGGLGADSLSASASNYDNRLFGEQGNDTLDGGGGNDLLVGGADADRLLGGAGYDSLEGGTGADVLDGGDGDDVLTGGAGADRFVFGNALAGYAFTDVITDFNLAEDKIDVSGLRIGDLATLRRLTGDDAGSRLEVYVGTSPSRLQLQGVAVADLTASNVVLNTAVVNDNLALSIGGDLFGGRGDDHLVGSASNYDNRFFGEQGNDTLEGGGGHDLLVGGTEDDLLLGGDGYDTLEGGAGNDVLDGGINDNLLVGGGGIDTASYASAAVGAVVDLAITGYQLTVDGTYDSRDMLSGIENLTGSAFADYLAGNNGANTLTGGAGNDMLAGRGGDDVLCGGAGSDKLSGGEGIDTASFADLTTKVTATLTDTVNGTATTVNGGGVTETDTLLNIENLIGGSGNDSLRGNAIANAISGGAGGDGLAGGAGRDTLTGGGGADRFIFDSTLGGTNVDTITDMASGADKIVLDDDVFTALGVVGTSAGVAISAGSFHVGTAAADASDRIIYDQATGKLYYDADGTGAGAMVQFAQLVGGTALAATDFLVIA